MTSDPKHLVTLKIFRGQPQKRICEYVLPTSQENFDRVSRNYLWIDSSTYTNIHINNNKYKLFRIETNFYNQLEKYAVMSPAFSYHAIKFSEYGWKIVMYIINCYILLLKHVENWVCTAKRYQTNHICNTFFDFYIKFLHTIEWERDDIINILYLSQTKQHNNIYLLR